MICDVESVTMYSNSEILRCEKDVSIKLFGIIDDSNNTEYPAAMCKDIELECMRDEAPNAEVAVLEVCCTATITLNPWVMLQT